MALQGAELWGGGEHQASPWARRWEAGRESETSIQIGWDPSRGLDSKQQSVVPAVEGSWGRLPVGQLLRSAAATRVASPGAAGEMSPRY